MSHPNSPSLTEAEWKELQRLLDAARDWEVAEARYEAAMTFRNALELTKIERLVELMESTP